MGSLSGAQREIIIGTLLGDGTMRCKTNALLEINHSVRQRAYVDRKYRNLATLVSMPPKERPGNGGRVAYRFVTRALPVLTPFYRLFYGSGAKSIPDGLELSPLTLAVWLMDDGSRSRRAVYLNTQQFDLVSQEKLLDLLRSQWGIRGSLHKDKEYRRIWVSVGSVAKLVSLVDRLILPEFRYKLPQVTP